MRKQIPETTFADIIVTNDRRFSFGKIFRFKRKDLYESLIRRRTNCTA